MIHVVGLDDINELISQQGVHRVLHAVALGNLERHKTLCHLVWRDGARGNLVGLGEKRLKLRGRHTFRQANEHHVRLVLHLIGKHERARDVTVIHGLRDHLVNLRKLRIIVVGR